MHGCDADRDRVPRLRLLTGIRVRRSDSTDRRPSSEQGFTLVELVIAMTLGLLVIGAAVTVFTAGIGTQPMIDKRAAQIDQARSMSDRLTRELRQGSNASSVNPAQLMILTYVPRTTCGGSTVGPDTRCRVFYSCTQSGATASCTRVECPPALLVPGTGCGPTTTVLTGLTTNQVFTFSPQTPGQAYVGIHLAFPAENGDDAITIQDGVALRNPPLGSS
jgi:prepilin-type N-terminal cleavage/methylation domain-containing protein